MNAQNKKDNANYGMLSMVGSQHELQKSPFYTTIVIHNDTEMVDARKLWQQLNSGRQFANWIRERIETYQFVENEDYIVFHKFVKNPKNKGNVVFNKFVKNPKGGRPRKEYYISFNMAKELSMLQANDKGKEARNYYIRLEKAFKSFLQKLQTPINGVYPIFSNGKFGYPRKEVLMSVGRSFKNGYRLRRQYGNDNCFNIGRTTCISEKLTHWLVQQLELKQMQLELFHNQKTLR